MSDSLQTAIRAICNQFENDPHRMMDIARAVQHRFNCVSPAAMDIIATTLAIARVEVESFVSFYAFLSQEPTGDIVIRLCNDIVDRFHGGDEVAAAFAQELGIQPGQTTSDLRISLAHTACIGMSDQAPAALVNDVVVTELSTDKARRIVRDLKEHRNPQRLVEKLGDGNNTHPLVQSMVRNCIRREGPVIFAPFESGKALRKALSMSPAEIIRSIKTSRLRGRGGAGFPTGIKWEFTRAAPGCTRYIICNADEGEPGTFKDRVILTERPDLLFEGMTIGGYALGGAEGILYLRGEYAYLQRFLEDVLHQRRAAGLLGKNIAGKEGFDFDIRIQMGAGAYICGAETALINSCEGLRGDPRNRPPFPAQEGYLGQPTCVNNVETLCCVARIVERGAAFFAQLGTQASTGTKLLSISGDCKQPGVYEVSFGISLREVLQMAGAPCDAAVQVGGPSGDQMVGADAYDRAICYDDLATGGAIVVFAQERDLLEVVDSYMEFFIEESCGYCTPCRVGNVLLKKSIEKVIAGRATPTDIEQMRRLCSTIKATSRCGLGQTSPNPILTTLKNFPALYENRLAKANNGFQPGFDLDTARSEASRITGRAPVRQ
jgi:[NiFe] hydrogenase diaphorase moiety large subunit